MNAKRWLSAVAGAAAFLLLSAVNAAAAAEPDCTRCHSALSKHKVVHAAVQAGCPTCHDALDASIIPHKVTGKVAKGLAAEQGELCLTCHDKAKFTKKVVHAALGTGCTACHDPHSSPNEKLLNKRVPTLCMDCHAQDEFTGKVVHAPVSGGMCTGCHDPHSADQAGLLSGPISTVCLECHADVKKSPHVVSGFSRRGHPLGDEARAGPVADPLRKGMAFSCTSCHEPHRSGFPKLLRIDPKAGMGLCQKCHPK